jgi:hypothetical protein
MRFTNPFARSFSVGLVLFVLIGCAIASRKSYSLATFPLSMALILLIAWFITALLVGLLADKSKWFHSWRGQIIGTWIGSLLVMVLMAVTAQFSIGNPTKAPKFDSTDQMMVYFADLATQWTKQDKNIDLDYSFDSIKQVETRLGEISKEVVKDNPQHGTFGIAVGYGAYIGEVFRRQYGGSWAVSDKVGGQNSYPLTTQSSNVSYPVMWCYKRLINGDEDNVYFKAMSFNEVSGRHTNVLKFQPTASSPRAAQSTN